MEEIDSMLRLRGFQGEVIGATPNHVELPPGVEYQRGHEIAAWLNQHPEVTTFVILDDSSDMAQLSDRLVQTSWERGLEQDHVDRAVQMLEAG